MKHRLAIVLLACSGLALFCLAAAAGPLRVVATTTIVGDIVAIVGGEAIELTTLFPEDADPHGFEPSPRDLVTLLNADLVFLSGAGLEEGLGPFLTDVLDRTVSLSEEAGIPLHDAEEDPTDDDHGLHDAVDPHVWFDPSYVEAWVNVIRTTLSRATPEEANEFEDRAATYIAALEALDAWIMSQVERIPREDRLLITDHAVFGYFADRYGFEQRGTILPGFSTLAEPSARELAELSDTIADLAIPVLFVGKTVNPVIAEQLAEDSGTKIVYLYTGSLSGPDGPAGSYIELMRYDVLAIVEGLMQSP